MKTTQYLYGVSPTEFSDLPYSIALQYKIGKASILIEELYEVSHPIRDDIRIHDIHKAIKFNAKLLEELKC